ncbi:MAG: fasciclin domain-containing protein [Saprospiraceae bacterium]|nr:fasciclin domain-containing protein [Saprospiraceae bacterium]
MKRLLLLTLLTVGLFSFQTVQAQCTSSGTSKAKTASYEKDIVDIAMGSADHQTLVAAVKAAELVSTLKSDGPFTVFAPTDAAFGLLPDGTVATLLKPENIGLLQTILTYHVVAGSLDSGAVINAIKAGNGKATLTTVQGGTLTAMIVDGNVMLMDENGGKATVTAVDLKGSNGVIHVIDRVIMPAKK